MCFFIFRYQWLVKPSPGQPSASPKRYHDGEEKSREEAELRGMEVGSYFTKDLCALMQDTVPHKETKQKTLTNCLLQGISTDSKKSVLCF
jgi:hypothetical protein